MKRAMISSGAEAVRDTASSFACEIRLRQVARTSDRSMESACLDGALKRGRRILDSRRCQTERRMELGETRMAVF